MDKEYNDMIVIGLIVAVLVFAILKLSFKMILKLLLNAAVGFVIIFVVNAFISMVGAEIPINLFSTIFVGIFGVPAALVLVVYYLWIK